MSSANDYSKLRGAVPEQGGYDYATLMAYCQNERNWFKRTRGEWPEPAEGMTTTITVVDGVDGLTPDMLRVRKECPDCGQPDGHRGQPGGYSGCPTCGWCE